MRVGEERRGEGGGGGGEEKNSLSDCHTWKTRLLALQTGSVNSVSVSVYVCRTLAHKLGPP